MMSIRTRWRNTGERNDQITDLEFRRGKKAWAGQAAHRGINFAKREISGAKKAGVTVVEGENTPLPQISRYSPIPVKYSFELSEG